MADQLPPIVDAGLVELLRAATDADVVIADVRWYLDGTDGRAAYEQQHIAGAVFVDLERDLSDHTRPATEGRHPLPTPRAFAKAMRRIGIGDNTTVIGYDDSGGGTAGRLVFMLRMLGRRAALLDGGLHAWTGALADGAAPTVASKIFTPVDWPFDRLATRADMEPNGQAIFDARSLERYRGEVAVADRTPGHIPGAGCVPWAMNLEPQTTRFRTPEAIRQLWGLPLTSPIICYCGSGVSACANMLALERAGYYNTRLFVPSWSGWSADPTNQVATGADPGGPATTS